MAGFRSKVSFPVSLVAGSSSIFWPNGDIIAASPALADVQSAVNAASDGWRVLIPNGSATWTGGITTTKQIFIGSQNFSNITGGSMSRNVTISNQTTSPTRLLDFTTGNSYHVGVAGIRFNDPVGGSTTGNHVRFNGSGTKIPLMWDCGIENSPRNGSSTDISTVAWLSLGGVMWNLYWLPVNIPAAGGPNDGVGLGAVATLTIKSPRAWTTDSTMGSLDTNGDQNVYQEDSTAYNVGFGFPDCDDAGRFVFRYNTLDGVVGITHGFTSGVYHGGRHYEYYNNTLQVSSHGRNMARRYFWNRAGTGVMTDNIVNQAVDTVSYGPMHEFEIGDNTSPSGSRPIPMQPGWGYQSGTDVSDPIYVWNESGSGSPAAYASGPSTGWGFQDTPGGWEAVVLVATSSSDTGKDVFVGLGAKPGYSKYSYPHPIRAAGGL
jgi:hypothetical protein